MFCNVLYYSNKQTHKNNIEISLQMYFHGFTIFLYFCESPFYKGEYLNLTGKNIFLAKIIEVNFIID